MLLLIFQLALLRRLYLKNGLMGNGLRCLLVPAFKGYGAKAAFYFSVYPFCGGQMEMLC